jgi:hypothetical protein
MTTHDQHTEVTQATEGSEPATQSTDQSMTQEQESSTTRTEPEAEPDSSTARTESATEQTRPFQPFTDAPTADAESSSGKALFGDDMLAGLRARWDDVQAGFVDDPRQCVQKADGLVSDVVDKLTSGFAEARTRLEEQWARGEEASTEELRIALKRYREFFQRLLSV